MLSEPTTAAEVLARARQTAAWRKSIKPVRQVAEEKVKPAAAAPIVVAPKPAPPSMEPPKPVKIPYELAVKLANIAKPNAWKQEDDGPTIRPTVMFIIRYVAERYGFTVADLQSHRRNMRLVWIRQIGYYVAKTMTTRSLLQIASNFGGRDHSSILSGINKVEGVLAVSEELRAEIKLICDEISTAVVDRSRNLRNSVDGGAGALPFGENIGDSNETSRHGVLPTPAGSSATA